MCKKDLFCHLMWWHWFYENWGSVKIMLFLILPFLLFLFQLRSWLKSLSTAMLLREVFVVDFFGFVFGFFYSLTRRSSVVIHWHWRLHFQPKGLIEKFSLKVYLWDRCGEIVCTSFQEVCKYLVVNIWETWNWYSVLQRHSTLIQLLVRNLLALNQGWI